MSRASRISDEMLLATLVQCDGNRSEASRRLDIERRTIQRRIHAINGTSVPPTRHSISVPKEWYWWLRKTMDRLDMPTMEATTVRIFTEWEERSPCKKS